MSSSITIPLRLRSVLNLREHWAAKAKRVKSERLAVWAAFVNLSVGGPPPYVVTLTRIAPRKISDEHDNLRAAFKGVVDEVASQLGVDDGHGDKVTWRYTQEPGPYGVRISVEAA